ncbi:hypothetical protein ACFC63_09220 [Streptomyces albidoflavus]
MQLDTLTPAEISRTDADADAGRGLFHYSVPNCNPAFCNHDHQRNLVAFEIALAKVAKEVAA